MRHEQITSESVITFALSEVSESEHLRRDYSGIVYAPDRLAVTVRNGVVISVEAEGPRVLKSGKLSDKERHGERYYWWDRLRTFRTMFNQAAPAWALEIAKGCGTWA